MNDAHGHDYNKRIESPEYLMLEGATCQTHHTYYYACKYCNASSKNDTNAFFEGVALGEHNPNMNWESNETHHWHKCTGCESKEFDKATHIDKNMDGMCDECKYEITPKPGTDTDSSSGNSGNEIKGGCSCGAFIGLEMISMLVVSIGVFAIYWFVIKKKKGF